MLNVQLRKSCFCNLLHHLDNIFEKYGCLSLSIDNIVLLPYKTTYSSILNGAKNGLYIIAHVSS